MELRIDVPTYYGSARNDGVDARPEFGGPYVPLVVRPAEGLRIVLGSTDYFDQDAPDIQIERRPGGWMVFLHPLGSGGASGHIIFLDDHRSFLIPARDLSSTPPTVTLGPDASIPELDEALKFISGEEMME